MLFAMICSSSARSFEKRLEKFVRTTEQKYEKYSKEDWEQSMKEYQAFLDEYKQSAEFAVANPAETGSFAEKFGIVPAAAIAAKAIPNCNICMFTGAEAKEMVTGFWGSISTSGASGRRKLILCSISGLSS